MTDRFIVIESPAKITTRDEQLSILLPDGEERTVPLEDMDSLLVDNAEATVTVPVICKLSAYGIPTVFCDGNHFPSTVTLSLHGNCIQEERFSLQMAAPEERLKELWAQTVEAKIRNQADLLDMLSLDGGPVRALADDVLPGDETNREAAAARLYWKVIFGPDFRRERFGDGPNPLLNYGYTILRSVTARATASAGLYPHKGIHHRNRYDDCCLADDLMEPFRPFVDLKVYELWNNGARKTDRDTRHELQKIPFIETELAGRMRTLANAVTDAVGSFVGCLKDTDADLVFSRIC